MNVLGIDYGRRKIGLALSTGYIAAPHSVLRVSSWQEAFRKVVKVVQVEKARKVVVGVSEGEMGEEQKTFAKELARNVGLKVNTWDETLTSRQAQVLARQAGLGQKRRREFEDAFAASVMLQSYLEAHGKKKGT